MPPEPRDLLARYNNLGVPDQTVLQALSALYEPASAGVVASCLTSANCRESPLRAFTVQTVAVRLGRLTKLGMAESLPPLDKNQKTPLWRCRPNAAELAIRHAVRDGMFNALAKAALAGTRGKDWHQEGAGESLRRNLRLLFHAGNWEAAAREAGHLDAERPGAAGAFLAELVTAQPDDSWLPRSHPDAAARLLDMSLADAVVNLIDPAPLLAAAEKLRERGAAGIASAMGNTMALCGKLRDAEKLAALAAPEGAARIRQTAAFVRGDDAASLAAAADALAAQRRRNATREPLPEGLNGVWFALSTLRLGDPEQLEKLEKGLAQAAGDHTAFAGEYGYIRLAVLYRLGQGFAARALPAAPEGDAPIRVLVHGLAMLWTDPARLPALLGAIEARAAQARRGGYRWLARQFAGLAGKAGGNQPVSFTGSGAENPPLLSDMFAQRDEWRRGLAALADLSGDNADPAAENTRRIAWLVGPAARADASPYCSFAVRPVEQAVGKSGVWSKGRNVSLKRLFQNRQEFRFAGEQDRMVFSTLRYDADVDGSGFYFDAGPALAFLIGHPHVYRDDPGGAQIEVTAGEFELSAAEKDGGLDIAIEPPLSEFLPGGAAAGGLPTSSPPDVAARFETPTRLRVFRLGRREKRLAMVVGDGLSVPREGREQALEVLSTLAKRVRVQSDAPELAAGEETLAADPVPRFHILPLNPGLKIEVWSHPLGEEGPAYRPGRGGRILSSESPNGPTRTVRDLARERELAGQAVAACPALAGHEEGDLSWRLDDPETSLDFLAEAGEAGELAVLTWPKGGRFRVRRFTNPASLGIAVARNSDWLELDGEVRIDENLTLSMAKLLAAARNATGRFVAIGDDEYLALTEELRRQLADLEAFAEVHEGKVRIPLLAGGLVEDLQALGADVKADAEWRRHLQKRKDLAAIAPPVPAGFNGELRDYQAEGFQWMARLAAWGAGACLADDMGLGKTIQALALLVERASLGPALVVAPTSVCHNWLAETKRFAPGLAAIAFGDGDREKLLARLKPGDILISSYGLLQQEDKLLAGVHWATAVLDEAQAIKNVATKRSRAAMNLKADFRLITTGTPIENHLGELWNLFRFVNPHLLGSWRRFQERFAAPIERHADAGARDNLRRAIRPFILRRTKSQVLHSLPPKTEITLEVEMGAEERAFYEALRRQALDRLGESEGGLEEKRFQILAEIMKLRRACCSPELITGDLSIPSAKQEQFRLTLEELLENNHKALVFSQFVSHLEILRRHLDEVGVRYQYLDGSTPAKKRKQAVEAFQGGDGDVFLISLKAGGLGLNLTAADYVIHMDPWWNPAVEDQASDRAHRIGQTRPVTVYRLVAAGTIEDKIVDLHHRKRDLADNLLSGADQAPAMDLEEIMRLLREDGE